VTSLDNRKDCKFKRISKGLISVVVINFTCRRRGVALKGGGITTGAATSFPFFAFGSTGGSGGGGFGMKGIHENVRSSGISSNMTARPILFI